jgi:hypothetical protein
MVLRLMPRSPWRRIRLASIAAGLMADRSGRTEFATDSLTPATDARTTRFCRTLQRRRLARCAHSRPKPPCKQLLAPDAARVHRIPPRVRDDRDPPLVRDETAGFLVLIWGGREGNCFFGRDWTGQIALIWLGKLTFASNGQVWVERRTTGRLGARHRNSKLKLKYLQL